MVRGMREWGVFAMVVMVCTIAASPVAARGKDGRPRPFGLLDEPTKSYGPTPPCMEDGVIVNCEWYGFGDSNYPADAANCLLVTRATLANTTRYPLGVLEPYMYYWFTDFVYDAAINASYCYYGCFDMTITTAPVGSPLSGLAPPPLVEVPASPPLSISTPPLVEMPTPPPPSVLDAPASAPVDVYPPPPSLLTPDTSGSPPPPDVVTLSPPPLGLPSIGGAGFLQPTGLVSFISGALLLLNGLLS